MRVRYQKELKSIQFRMEEAAEIFPTLGKEQENSAKMLGERQLGSNMPVYTSRFHVPLYGNIDPEQTVGKREEGLQYNINHAGFLIYRSKQTELKSQRKCSKCRE